MRGETSPNPNEPERGRLSEPEAPTGTAGAAATAPAAVRPIAISAGNRSLVIRSFISLLQQSEAHYGEEERSLPRCPQPLPSLANAPTWDPGT